MFYKKFFKLCLHLICLSIALYTRPRVEKSDETDNTTR